MKTPEQIGVEIRDRFLPSSPVYNCIQKDGTAVTIDHDIAAAIREEREIRKKKKTHLRYFNKFSDPDRPAATCGARGLFRHKNFTLDPREVTCGRCLKFVEKRK